MSTIDPNSTQLKQIEWEKKAMEAERKAQERIQESRNKIRQTQLEEEQELRKIKDEYQKMRLIEREKSGYDLMQHKTQHAAKIQDLKRSQQREYYNEKNRLKNELTETQRELTEKINHERTQGQNTLLDTQMRYQNLIESEIQKANIKKQSLEQSTQEEFQNSQLSFEEKRNQTLQENNAHLENLKNNHMELLEKKSHQFHEKFINHKNTLGETIRRADIMAQNQLERLQKDSTQRLSLYSSQQSDPFYQIKDLDAKVHETQSGFLITASIPQHEQKNIRISVRDNDSVILTGKRRNSDTRTTENGITKTTHSYQTFSQSIPIRDSIEQRLVTKKFEGDQLQVFLPKKSGIQKTPPFQANKTSSISAYQKPQFPEMTENPTLSKKV